MWEMLVTVLVKLPDWFSKLADRTVVRIKMNYFKYELFQNDADSSVVVITAYPSRYHLKLGFANSGNTTTIQELRLIINSQILSPSIFEPLKLEHGDYKTTDAIFPVDETQAIDKGTYEIQAIYAFNKVCKSKGQFPIVGEP